MREREVNEEDLMWLSQPVGNGWAYLVWELPAQHIPSRAFSGSSYSTGERNRPTQRAETRWPLLTFLLHELYFHEITISCNFISNFLTFFLELPHLWFTWNAQKKIERQLLPVKNVSSIIWKTRCPKNHRLLTEKVKPLYRESLPSGTFAETRSS